MAYLYHLPVMGGVKSMDTTEIVIVVLLFLLLAPLINWVYETISLLNKEEDEDEH